ncbi:MAG TPA: PEP-CTERM sorting domain-containing protein [Pyrinomonadaceae bacterium]
MKKIWLYLLAALATFILHGVVLATPIVVSVGNTNPINPFENQGGLPFVSGNAQIGSDAVLANLVAPFATFCGSVNGGDGGATGNCDTSWTFVYVIPAGETITSATLTVALWDLDSRQAGNQVALYQINGGDVLTSALNTAAEALNGGTGAGNNEYDVFTFSLTNFAALSGGSVTVHLTFAGPGGTVFNDPTTNNAGAILYSTLSITTQPTDGTAVPEPGTWLLFVSGISVLGGRRFLFRRF